MVLVAGAEPFIATRHTPHTLENIIAEQEIIKPRRHRIRYQPRAISISLILNELFIIKVKKREIASQPISTF